MNFKVMSYVSLFVFLSILLGTECASHLNAQNTAFGQDGGHVKPSSVGTSNRAEETDRPKPGADGKDVNYCNLDKKFRDMTDRYEVAEEQAKDTQAYITASVTRITASILKNQANDRCDIACQKDQKSSGRCRNAFDGNFCRCGTPRPEGSKCDGSFFGFQECVAKCKTVDNIKNGHCNRSGNCLCKPEKKS